MIQFKKFITVITLTTLSIVSTSIAFADNSTIEDEINSLKTRIAQLEKASVSSNKQAPSIADGLVVEVGSTLVLQATHDANGTSRRGEDVTDSTYSLDISFSKAVGDSGNLFATLEAGNGNGVAGDEVITFSSVNGDALAGNKKLDIAEVGYTQAFMDGKFSLTFGVLDSAAVLDANLLANDECTQFLNSAFINSTAIEFTNDYSLGAVITAEINPCVTLDIGAYEDDSDFEDSSDKHLIFAQGTVKTENGNYRLFFWNDNSNHTNLTDPTRTNESNSGVGISFDQQIWDNMGIFLRYAMQDSDVSVIDRSWSVGSSINGSLWDRENDAIGLAIGQNMPSDKYKEAGNPADDETVLEIFYKWQANNNIAISPDIQLIWSPNGVDNSIPGRDDTVLVAGIRAQLDF